MQGVRAMPAPNIPANHIPSVWTWLTGGGLGIAIKAMFDYLSKSKERSAAKQKLAAEAAVAHEKIEVEASTAKDKLEQEALLAKEARVEDGVWKLIKETRDYADHLRSESQKDIAAMAKRVDDLSLEVATQKERASFAEVLTSVANARADDADADRRELKAKLSIALMEIESLQHQLKERDDTDRQKEAYLKTLHLKLEEAEKRLETLTTKTLD